MPLQGLELGKTQTPFPLFKKNKNRGGGLFVLQEQDTGLYRETLKITCM